MNKVKKIKAEIERLKNVIEFSGKLRCFPYAAIFLDEVLGRLLSFIDSLEQPIKRTPADIEAAMQEVEEKSKLFTEAHKDDVVSNDTLKVISNDLEEAARKAATWHSRVEGDKFFPNDYQKFIAGAQWQKNQAVKWLKENKDHPFIKCEDPCLSGYLTDEFIEDFKKAMEE